MVLPRAVILITVFSAASATLLADDGFDCKNNPDGNYPNPYDGFCGSFIKCTSGVPENWVCLADLFYSPNADYCIWPDVDWCTEYKVPKRCSDTQNLYAMIPTAEKDDCKTYIYCYTGETLTCPEGTGYSNDRRGCVKDGYFRCDESTPVA